MVRSFILSFRLKNAYRVNSIIYSIKQLPIIKNILSDRLYKNKGLKVFATIISILIEIISVFLGKLLYLFLMIYSFLSMYQTAAAATFLHIFTFLTLAGALMNTYMFNPTKDKYYAMILMRMDAKSYTLSNYYYQLLKVIIGFLPFTILFGLLLQWPLWLSLAMPVYVVMSKMIVSYYYLHDFQKTKKARNENLPSGILWGLIAIFLLAAYGLPFLQLVISPTIFLVLFIISCLLGIYSFVKINMFSAYKKVYKQLLTAQNTYTSEKNNHTELVKQTSLKQIELGKEITSHKSGFAYFHELFVKRHQKILTKTVKKQVVIILCILIAAIIGVLLDDTIKERTNQILLTYLPYFVFIMYLLNRGMTLTQAMFMNCDHSMLTYKIYRTPKVILGMFKERLKTLITINLIPAILIGGGLALLLYLSGGTSNDANYLVLIVSIMAMSIFFSVHYLVLYYLLQPYNVNTEMKSSTYKVVQFLTYFVSYLMIEWHLPTLLFGGVMIFFCIAYSFVSLLLVYHYAPKTFKLRI